MTITIFTPSYNRAYTLVKLYKSLCEQTDKNFIWLIVDDGSTDNTEELVNRWIREKIIDIRYLKQKNAGKSAAHNTGVNNTKTELFCCVDSDDVLTMDAIAEIKRDSSRLSQCIGIVYKRGTHENDVITKWDKSLNSATFFDAEKKFGLRGDTMLVFKVQYLKKYSFPVFQGEKFVPENYLYDYLSNEGELLFIDKVLYLCEYLPDGYTSNMRRVIVNNPLGYRAYIKKRVRMNYSFIEKLKDVARFVAIQCVIEKKEIFKQSPSLFYTIFALPLGVYFYRKEYKKYLDE